MDNIEQFKSQCEILHHKKSGAKTEDVVLELSEQSINIIKSLVLKSGNYFFAVIISGNNKLDIKKVKKYFNVSKISFANPDEIEKLTNFRVGGIPPYAFYKKCKTLIDAQLMKRPYVIGSGGDEFTGIKFNPKNLLLLYDNITDISLSTNK